MLVDLWQRATATQPPLPTGGALVLAAVALLVVLSPLGSLLVRHVVTLVHEGGHAIVAALVGRRLHGIRLHRDTSGLTVSRGRPSGPGMVATVAAGYPAPALVGLAGAALTGQGYAAGWLWLLVLACAALLLLVRNLFGLWVVLLTGGAVAALSWGAPPPVIGGAAHLVVWSLLLGAPRGVVGLQRARRRGARDSDADQLARLTGVPAGVWVAGFWLFCLACLVLGATLLLQLR